MQGQIKSYHYVLGIDTSSGISVGLFDRANNKQYERNSTETRQHLELLHKFIQEIMQEANILINKIDCIVVGLGPGAFMGLRIGISSVLGLKKALEVPVLGVSSLEALKISFAWQEYGILQQENSELGCSDVQSNSNKVISVLDAKRGQVFWEEFPSEISSFSQNCKSMLHPTQKTDKIVKHGRGSEVPKNSIAPKSDTINKSAAINKSIATNKANELDKASNLSSYQEFLSIIENCTKKTTILFGFNINSIPEFRKIPYTASNAPILQPFTNKNVQIIENATINAGELAKTIACNGNIKTTKKIHPQYIRLADIDIKMQQKIKKKQR